MGVRGWPHWLCCGCPDTGINNYLKLKTLTEVMMMLRPWYRNIYTQRRTSLKTSDKWHTSIVVSTHTLWKQVMTNSAREECCHVMNAWLIRGVLVVYGATTAMNNFSIGGHHLLTCFGCVVASCSVWVYNLFASPKSHHPSVRTSSHPVFEQWCRCWTCPWLSCSLCSFDMWRDMIL